MAAREEVDPWVKWNKRLRDLALFGLGFAGAINELFLRSEIRPTAIPVVATLLGLPLVLHADEKKAEK